MHQSWNELSAQEKADQARVMAVYSAMIDSIDTELEAVAMFSELLTGKVQLND